MADLAYNRILLKLSGESLKGDLDYGIDPKALAYLAGEIKEAFQMGVQLSAVVGGGNFWRGNEWEARGMDRGTADYMGMLATLLNSLALQDSLEREGLDTRVMTAIDVRAVAEPYIRRRAITHLERNRLVLFASGTGNPYMTTDTAAALRSLEIDAEVLFMAKNRVDGVYDSDPHNNPGAKKFQHLDYIEALNLRLEVMDATALSLCMENQLPIVVFDLFIPGSLSRLLRGDLLGTVVGQLQAPTTPQGDKKVPAVDI